MAVLELLVLEEGAKAMAEVAMVAARTTVFMVKWLAMDGSLWICSLNLAVVTK